MSHSCKTDISFYLKVWEYEKLPEIYQASNSKRMPFIQPIVLLETLNKIQDMKKTEQKYWKWTMENNFAATYQ